MKLGCRRTASINERLIMQLLTASRPENTFASSPTRRLCLDAAVRIQWLERLLKEGIGVVTPFRNGDEVAGDQADLCEWLRAALESLK